MRLLVIFCHPSSESYGAALYETACRTLRAAGHELRCHDLYREGFDPVLSTEEWGSYLSDTDSIITKHSERVDELHWAEGLVIIYPTWYYGVPAMLKGWLERVWLPGVTFEISDGKQRLPKRETDQHPSVCRHYHVWQSVVVDQADPRSGPQPVDARFARSVQPPLQDCLAAAVQYEPHHGCRPRRFLAKVERRLSAL